MPIHTHQTQNTPLQQRKPTPIPILRHILKHQRPSRPTTLQAPKAVSSKKAKKGKKKKKNKLQANPIHRSRLTNEARTERKKNKSLRQPNSKSPPLPLTHPYQHLHHQPPLLTPRRPHHRPSPPVPVPNALITPTRPSSDPTLLPSRFRPRAPALRQRVGAGPRRHLLRGGVGEDDEGGGGWGWGGGGEEAEEEGAEGGEAGGDDVIGGLVDGPDGPDEGGVCRGGGVRAVWVAKGGKAYRLRRRTGWCGRR